MRELVEKNSSPIERLLFYPDLDSIENVWNLVKYYIQNKYLDISQGRKRTRDEIRHIVAEA